VIRSISSSENLVLSAVIKHGCPRRFMVGDLLRDFQLGAVLQIRRDAGRAKGMIANPRFDAGRFRAPADDAMGVLLEEGIGCKLAGLAAGGAEEIAVDVIGDAGRFDVIVQILIETMMTGNVVLLTARPPNSRPRRPGCRCRQGWQVGPRADDQ
jgi:hypothetical protein